MGLTLNCGARCDEQGKVKDENEDVDATAKNLKFAESLCMFGEGV